MYFTILNSIVTVHDINIIYQMICTITEGNGKLRHPTYREEAAISRNYPYLGNNRFNLSTQRNRFLHIERNNIVETDIPPDL